jgi:hypothetical protein
VSGVSKKKMNFEQIQMGKGIRKYDTDVLNVHKNFQI